MGEFNGTSRENPAQLLDAVSTDFTAVDTGNANLIEEFSQGLIASGPWQFLPGSLGLGDRLSAI